MEHKNFRAASPQRGSWRSQRRGAKYSLGNINLGGIMEEKGLGKRINLVRKERGFTADRLWELCNINATYLRQKDQPNELSFYCKIIIAKRR